MSLSHSSISRSEFLYGGSSSRYRRAARRARNRSGGVCQACGQAPAAEAHHWAWPRERIPGAADVRHTDLTGLCRPCHQRAEAARDALAAGVPPEILTRAFGRLARRLARRAARR